MERKIEMKIRYFIKKKMETSTLHHHGILTQKFRKNFKTQVTQEQEKEQNSTPQISTDTRRFISMNCQILGQLNIHRTSPISSRWFSQSKPLQISDICFQVSKFHFHIGTLMLKSHEVEQRLLVLFRVPSSQKPPVINCQQSKTWI